MGRDCLRAGGPRRLRARPPLRRGGRGAGRGNARRALRRTADADPHGRVGDLPAQSGQQVRCAGPTHRVPHLALQGRRILVERRTCLHPGGWQGRACGRRLLGREPVRRRPHGRGRKRLRPESHASQPDGGRRDGARAAAPPFRARGRGARTRGCSGLQGGVEPKPRSALHRGREAQDTC